MVEQLESDSIEVKVNNSVVEVAADSVLGQATQIVESYGFSVSFRMQTVFVDPLKHVQSTPTEIITESREPSSR